MGLLSRGDASPRRFEPELGDTGFKVRDIQSVARDPRQLSNVLELSGGPSGERRPFELRKDDVLQRSAEDLHAEHVDPAGAPSQG
ncbi:MAG: hypothetical protein HOV80_13630 [Polyangiaceae bacterium]|nr:hypothetical protein [Polyangiaceae bacterium]